MIHIIANNGNITISIIEILTPESTSKITIIATANNSVAPLTITTGASEYPNGLSNKSKIPDNIDTGKINPKSNA